MMKADYVKGTPLKIETIQKACKRFGLGEITQTPLAEDGDGSYNLKVKTSKGTYMVRSSRGPQNNQKTRQREREHRATDYLSRQNFPYDIPVFIQDENSQEIVEIDGHIFDAYKRIAGEIGDEKRPYFSNEMVNAIAQYHKAIQGFNMQSDEMPSWERGYDAKNKLEQKLLTTKEEIRNPKTIVDQLMFEHIDQLIDITRTIKSNESPNRPTMLTYGDFHPGNLVYSQGGIITGVIDFGDVTPGSEEEDFKKMPIPSKKELESIVSRYRLINPLSEEKVKQLIPTNIMHQVELIMHYFHTQNEENQKFERVLRKIQNVTLSSNTYTT